MWNSWPPTGSYTYRRSGHVAFSLITAPTLEPLSVAEAKRHLKLDTDEMDADVAVWITAARQQVEKDAGVALLTQTWDLALDEFPWSCPLRIDLSPLQSVTYVKYYDSGNTLQTLASTNYVVDTASFPPRLGLTPTGTWPSDLRTFQPGLVRGIFGWTSATAVPGPLIHAIKLMVTLFDQNREPTVLERSTYDRLIDSWALQVW